MHSTGWPAATKPRAVSSNCELTSFAQSTYDGWSCMVCGVPCMCMMQIPQPLLRTVLTISGSRNPETSLIKSAPASSAAWATRGLRVSIEMSPSVFASRSASITGMTRLSSSSTDTASAFGRVDSPPISIHVAPCCHMWRPALTAESRVPWRLSS